MSDSNSTARLIQKMEADYFSKTAVGDDVTFTHDVDVDQRAREIRKVIREFKIPSSQVKDLLLYPEEISTYQDLPLEFVDKVFEMTQDFDFFEIQKLTSKLR